MKIANVSRPQSEPYATKLFLDTQLDKVPQTLTA